MTWPLWTFTSITFKSGGHRTTLNHFPVLPYIFYYIYLYIIVGFTNFLSVAAEGHVTGAII